ncbi:hypothetical protein PVAP13_6KG214506 [Panicum virgatum]|uniref:Uncharacterized protein n=1 Tax=Panicum virgatum TaxID=38727 RepID=A0A8T0RC56_PANVG|nr:hypothetical protein PVAP13_6KG214506 [Panicum virgatum]
MAASHGRPAPQQPPPARTLPCPEPSHGGPLPARAPPWPLDASLRRRWFVPPGGGGGGGSRGLAARGREGGGLVGTWIRRGRRKEGSPPPPAPSPPRCSALAPRPCLSSRSPLPLRLGAAGLAPFHHDIVAATRARRAVASRARHRGCSPAPPRSEGARALNATSAAPRRSRRARGARGLPATAPRLHHGGATALSTARWRRRPRHQGGIAESPARAPMRWTWRGGLRRRPSHLPLPDSEVRRRSCPAVAPRHAPPWPRCRGRAAVRIEGRRTRSQRVAAVAGPGGGGRVAGRGRGGRDEGIE